MTDAFNPLMCPNMKCKTTLEAGKKECPQCGEAWVIDCVCERKKKTSYLRDVCQKCLEKRPISIEHREKHALLTTVAQCLKNNDYVEALEYFDQFPHLLKNPQVVEKKAHILKIYHKEQKNDSAEIEMEKEETLAEKEHKALIAQKEREEYEQAEIQRKQQEHQRKQEIEKLQTIHQMGDLNEAFDYYCESFPQNLKNHETQKVFEQVCDELIAPHLEKAQVFFKQKSFWKSEKSLQDVPSEYRTAAWHKLLEYIYFEGGQNSEKAGNFATAIKIWKLGMQTFPENQKMSACLQQIQNRVEELNNQLQKAKTFLKEGNLDKAKEVLQNPLFFVSLPEQWKTTYLMLAAQLEEAQQKSTLGGKLKYWARNKKKEEKNKNQIITKVRKKYASEEEACQRLLDAGANQAHLDRLSDDGRFGVLINGIIVDTKTKLQWYVGLDKDLTWDQGNAWVKKLDIDGGGWRMPTIKELERLYEKDKREKYPYIDRVFNTSGNCMWSGELCNANGKPSNDEKAPCAHSFYFYLGTDLRLDRNKNEHCRMFAVRCGKQVV